MKGLDVVQVIVFKGGQGRVVLSHPWPPRHLCILHVESNHRHADFQYSRHSFSLVLNLSKYLCQGRIFGTTRWAKIPKIPYLPLLFCARLHRNYTDTKGQTKLLEGLAKSFDHSLEKKGVGGKLAIRTMFVTRSVTPIKF